jgi:hypothetical protein
MRNVGFLVVLVLAACGKDYGTEIEVDGGVLDAPDGRIITPPEDGGSAVPDATVELTDCEEATQHSDLAWLQDKVFTPSCATAMCHAGPDPDVGLNLEAGRAHANLVNRGSSTMTGWVRVVPGSLPQSYLIVAMGRAEGPPPRDGFMPLGAEALCVEKLEAIERWVLAGAPP